MERKFTFSPGEYYHLYNRGTDKRKIFLSDADHKRFLCLLYVGNSLGPIHISDHGSKKIDDLFYIPRASILVDIGAYCLMPNHFHLLVRARTQKGVSTFMKKLLTGYSMYFNKKNERTGKLFEGPFRAQHVTDDRYLEYLFGYIHLNPVKIIQPQWKERGIKNLSQIKSFLQSYPYSSYPLFNSGENTYAERILNRSSFPKYFETTRDFHEFIDLWLTANNVKESP